MLLTILLCLTQVLFPDLAAYLAQLEVRSATFAVAFFVFLLNRLWLDRR